MTRTPAIVLAGLLCLLVPLFCFADDAPKKKAKKKAVTDDRGVAVVAKGGNGRKRVALVIGNGAYRHTDSMPKLANPANDADDMAAALRRFGFEVIARKNLTKEEMEEAITDFGRRAADGDAALFYYAGHGLQVKGQNYLVPVDANIDSEAKVSYRAVNVNLLLEEMESSRSRVNVVMLDACRNNPISGKFRSGGTRGLAAPSAMPNGTVIVYATGPGNVAADGGGRNGLFTAGLLSAFKGNDLTLGGVLTRASEEVEKASDQQQSPYINGPATVQKRFSFAAPSTMTDLKPSETQPQPVVTAPAPAAQPPAGGDVEMVTVPGGCFTVNGKQVCLDAFRIGRYDVTQGQYQQVMGTNPSEFKECGANCPVENVSWDDAQAFISRLNNQTGKRYRLPTEAEWEYACRSAGRDNYEYCGGDNIDAVAWYRGNSGKTTHPVGQKQPNSLGLYDMSGNVWQWVSDWDGGNYPSSGNNPTGASSGSYRVFRGGSWYYDPAGVRAAYRGSISPMNRGYDLGFRLVAPVE